MPHAPTERSAGALIHLLKVCLRDAAASRETREALGVLQDWLGIELEAVDSGKAGSHGVLTPAARGRVSAAEPSDGASLTSGLDMVLNRTKWKAAACRVSVGRQGLRHLEGGERSAAEAQLANQERALRDSLTGLRDTVPWMLDQPFGIRVSHEQAFDVPDESAAGLAVVAECYETLSFAVERARDLEEAGTFQDGPPRAFLYLLAEAQSALLASIVDAPVRSDSDQREVFLWLKEQTTRFRIYVDRHMRLDDLADCSQSADLRGRITRLSDELTRDRRDRRQRGQLLGKVRYHVGKLLDEGGATRSEADSLGVALKRWAGAGLDRSDRGLSEALQGLRERLSGLDRDVIEVLKGILGEDRAAEPAADAAGDEDRHVKSLEDARQLLSSMNVVLLAPPSSSVDAEELAAELCASEFDLSEVDVDGPKAERDATLEAALAGEGARLFLLGVRLGPEEYNAFKERCLERKFAFVRLPGPLVAPAIAHQVMRQVGWRLRAQLDGAAS